MKIIDDDGVCWNENEDDVGAEVIGGCVGALAW